MKKNIKSIFLILMLVLTTVFVCNKMVDADSYPSAFFYDDENFENLVVTMNVTEGDNVPIRMKWYAAYKNERYEMNIYDPDGELIASSSGNIYGDIEPEAKITNMWDTTGLKFGRYTVEVTKEFYSLYSWNEAPTTEKLDIVIADRKAPAKVKNFKTENNSKGTITVTYDEVKLALGYEIQYSMDKNFKNKSKSTKTKVTSIKIKNLKKGKTYFVRVRACNTKRGKWSSVKKIKIKK